MKLTASDLQRMGMIEHVIPEEEPVSREEMDNVTEYLEKGILEFLEQYRTVQPDKLLEKRYERFRKM